MCDEADYYYTVQESRARVARKEHVCCACEETVQVGHKYVTTFAIGGDAPESYKHCLRCWTMLSSIRDARGGDVAIRWELDCGEDWQDTIGELPPELEALAFLTADEAQSSLGANNIPRLVETP